MIQQGKIILAGEEDAPRIRQIMEISVRLLPCRDWFLDDDIPYILRQIRGEGYILKYMVGKELAGYLSVHRPGLTQENLGHTLHLPPSQLMRVRHLDSACVLPQYRGRHIQRSLMEEAVRREAAKGQTAYLMATVHPDNLYSLRNLMAVGFSPVKTAAVYGDWVRTVMVRKL